MANVKRFASQAMFKSLSASLVPMRAVVPEMQHPDQIGADAGDGIDLEDLETGCASLTRSLTLPVLLARTTAASEDYLPVKVRTASCPEVCEEEDARAPHWFAEEP